MMQAVRLMAAQVTAAAASTVASTAALTAAFPAVTASILVFAIAATPVAAADFRAVTDAAILYDAPAVRGKKLYVAPRGMPVEVVVANEGWARVRDKSGELAWIERKFLSEKRTVIANAPVVAVREQAGDSAKVVITVAHDVVLELVDPPSSGWVKVKHRDGATGFVAIGQVWGL